MELFQLRQFYCMMPFSLHYKPDRVYKTIKKYSLETLGKKNLIYRRGNDGQDQITAHIEYSKQ